MKEVLISAQKRDFLINAKLITKHNGKVQNCEYCDKEKSICVRNVFLR